MAVAAIAREELLILLPPGIGDWAGTGAAIRPGARRGLRMVVSSIEQARTATSTLPPACSGEVRIHPELRTYLLLADREMAVLIGERNSFKVLEARPQVRRLVAMFERYWGHGRSVDGASDAVHVLQKEILGRLAAGLTDQAVAKELGISPRTVQRHVKKAMEELGARSRFELGVRLALANR
ncbi:helix-turn-helix transcriptional regulator [Actinomadura xylanilytica]|uniref:helix-turn-helix transcriptional regulator n=1 Tax=Actinomadura xylanilytica TaxID=887459 RepID=UPI00255B0E76|nr:helix-turn-helix transcriptional regulator [Actinomadura xylanilytica]MDL4774203.1 helix-turn-helix transcriptional regulator [Actinomadura xylanilytica]